MAAISSLRALENISIPKDPVDNSGTHPTYLSTQDFFKNIPIFHPIQHSEAADRLYNYAKVLDPNKVRIFTTYLIHESENKDLMVLKVYNAATDNFENSFLHYDSINQKIMRINPKLPNKSFNFLDEIIKEMRQSITDKFIGKEYIFKGSVPMPVYKKMEIIIRDLKFPLPLELPSEFKPIMLTIPSPDPSIVSLPSSLEAVSSDVDTCKKVEFIKKLTSHMFYKVITKEALTTEWARQDPSKPKLMFRPGFGPDQFILSMVSEGYPIKHYVFKVTVDGYQLSAVKIVTEIQQIVSSYMISYFNPVE